MLDTKINAVRATAFSDEIRKARDEDASQRVHHAPASDADIEHAVANASLDALAAGTLFTDKVDK